MDFHAAPHVSAPPPAAAGDGPGSRADAPGRRLPRPPQSVWDGTPLEGRRVLIRCCHGLGDTLQFIRYALLVREIATEVTVRAQPELFPLLRSARGIDRLLPLHDDAPEVEHDVDVEIMELPHVFRTTLRTVPAEAPYLRTDPAPLPRDGRLAVGIVWRAGDWNERRSVPVERRAPLAERSEGFGVVSGSDDVLEAAGVLRALDLLVSVDTMPAHLAGALGVPVWTLLHADPDWRWIRGRDDSPWYPAMRLFRQERPGEWEPVVARVGAELERLASVREDEGAERQAPFPPRAGERGSKAKPLPCLRGIEGASSGEGAPFVVA